MAKKAGTTTKPPVSDTPASPETIDGETGKLEPLPPFTKRDLSSMRGVRRAIAKVIMAEAGGTLDHFRARGMVWMLRELGAQIRDHELEVFLRSGLEELEAGRLPAAPGLRAIN